jgi:uncharacterized ion transporter superfamily protein YfcC
MSDNFGKWIVILGLFIAFIGLIIWGVSKLGLPLGKLPGDYRSDHFYFPVVSSLVISIILTIVLNLVIWMMRR